MIKKRVAVLAFAISISFHFLVLSSREVMGFFLGKPSPRAKVEKTLVFDLVKEEKPKPKKEAEKQKWFVDSDENEEKPSAETNLRGVKQSTAKDHAPKDKKPDGIPNLDGTSEMVAVRDREFSADEARPQPNAPPVPAPVMPVAPPMPPMTPAPPQPPAPQPAAPPPKPEPAKASAPAEPPRESKPKDEARPKLEPGREKEMALARREERTLPVKPEAEPKPNVKAPSPRTEEGPAKEPKRAEPAPPAEPVQIAALPKADVGADKEEKSVAPPTTSPAPEKRPEPVTPRVAAPRPPSLPPREMAKLKSMFPESSAGKEGEPSFNIQMDLYAPYYKHIAERLELTWNLLRRYESGLPMPGTPQQTKMIFTFVVLRDGTIKDVAVVHDGGDPMIATEIQRIIQNTPLDPFPAVIAEERLFVRPVVHFRYY